VRVWPAAYTRYIPRSLWTDVVVEDNACRRCDAPSGLICIVSRYAAAGPLVSERKGAGRLRPNDSRMNEFAIAEFRKSVRDGDVEAVRHLLQTDDELRAAINDPIFEFNSPALVAVSGHDDVALVDVLLEFGADPNQKSSWWAGGFHPLYSAAPAEADRLLAAGAIPDACAAAHLDRVDILEEMLAQDPSRVHERGGDGQTPLHFAATRRVVDLLLDAGADIDARDVDHRSTAAEWMLGDIDRPESSRGELARYLVERGASADIFLAAALGLTSRARELLDANPNLLSLRTGQGIYGIKPPSSFHIYQWTIGSGLTPLDTAAKFGRRETLNAMLPYASVEQKLLLACHDGDRDAALAIVRSNPGIVEGLDSASRHAVTSEAWAANAPAVELMMELGFDPSIPTPSGPSGVSALHCAAWEGSPECVAAILAYPRGRALIETRDSAYDNTPLGWCIHGSLNCERPHANHAEAARLLIEAGARLPEGSGEASDDVRAVIDAARQSPH
jgi:ankyrin repeat protein